MPDITEMIINYNIEELDVKVKVSWFNGMGEPGI